MPTRPAPPVRADSVWARRLSDPGWLLLPLRAFLGITFCYAGLQKLANPAYLDANSPTSAAGQMRLLRHSSPIGALLGASLHATVLVGLAIALGEVAVGVGTLLGLFSRAAAIGGALLSLSFFLTVSWSTTPYYYGSDIVFVFAWVTLFAFGTPDAFSLESWVRGRVHRAARLRPGRAIRSREQAELDRRTALALGGSAALVASATAVTAGLTAAIGRVAHHANRAAGPQLAPDTGVASAPTAAPGSSTASASANATGTAIGPSTAVPVGQAKSFNDPATGEPAWIVHPSGDTFVAFSAVCTHAGCPVQYDQSSVQFVCPCHGGVFDARTGHVIQGPPSAPLPRIPVQLVAGEIRVDT